MIRSFLLACVSALGLPACFAVGLPEWACNAEEQVCAAGTTCIDGACKRLCELVTDCPGNEACVRGLCEPYRQACSNANDCRAGFGCDGQSCVKIVGDCHPDVPGGCDVNASCTPSGSGHVCLCNAGFESDGRSCSDIDECAADARRCGARRCVNTPGSYECLCPAGYLDVGAQACASRWLALAAGRFHTCGVRGDHSLWCWGNNDLGQLGDGSRACTHRPSQVGSDADWQELSLGAAHTCAIKTDGRLFCWGDNHQGQLGVGDGLDRTGPAQVGQATWLAVAAGSAHSCGVRADGTLWCWGSNEYDQLGRAGGNASRPERIGLLDVWTSVSSSAEHSCALTSDERLYCWGRNDHEQVLRTAASTIAQPSEVRSSIRWRSVGAGAQHSCGLQDDGRLWCWGANDEGQLGVEGAGGGTLAGVGGTWQGLAVGAFHTCALTPSGQAHCFGDNAFAQLGVASLVDATSPQLLAQGNWATIAAGGRHTCGLDRDGALSCFGDGDHGQLGDGRGAFRPPLTGAGEDSIEWIDVAVGGSHACAIAEAGGLWCWGSNASHALGLALGYAEAPAIVDARSGWSAIATGQGHSCGLRNGQVYCFGANQAGQAGGDSVVSVETPTVVGVVADWLRISAGGAHTCGIREVAPGAGTLWCWGSNDAGQLGRGVAALGAQDPTPEPVAAAATWQVVSAGARHTCAIQQGELWCFGSNAAGQLGHASGPGNEPEPVRVGQGDDWVDVVAGAEGTCGVRAPGALWCWGRVGSRDFGSSPVLLDASITWSAVTLGAEHLCALGAEGRVSCLGSNTEGQLGAGTRNAHAQLVQVLGSAGYAALAAGGHTTCGVRDGALVCWGADDGGQRGDGRAWLPQAVLEP